MGMGKSSVVIRILAIAAIYFILYPGIRVGMMLEVPEGRNYSFSEVSRMLTSVGFTNIEKKSLTGPAEIVIGYKKN